MADALAVSVRTLARWRRQRKGPPWVKVGRRPMYPWAAARAHYAK